MAVRTRQEAAAHQAEETLRQAREEATQIVTDARADADAEVSAARLQVQELERQRDSVANYLEEMRGVLGGALPQVPVFSDRISAVLEEADALAQEAAAGSGDEAPVSSPQSAPSPGPAPAPSPDAASAASSASADVAPSPAAASPAVAAPAGRKA